MFEPDFDSFTFRGVAAIQAWCHEPLTVLDLDAADLDIQSCRVWCNDELVESSVSCSDDALLIHMPKPIQGNCVIHIEYTGILNDHLLGFYKSRYTDGSKTKYLATTQFEAADARRAFPCWDEPNHKATFDVIVRAPFGMTAISNMPSKTVTEADNYVEYVFYTTPVMSTYLVYVGVGEFEHIQNLDGSIRVVTVRGKSEQGRYALELTERLLEMYADYFGKKYPLPKIDLIALPDFAAGAMENWGAITFRENLLLYDPKNSSTHTQQLIAEVVSHELAHQWFGNLVTMEWWNDLWLNESFATFIGTKMVDKLYPEWGMWEQFVEDSMNNAMEMDSLESTHPIDVDVESPSQIREIFDAISYDKGGCMLRMLEDFVGAVNFRNGLRKYLRAFKYANATGADLWDSIEWACHEPIRSILEPWLKNPGFPIVSASSTVFAMTLKQERFSANGDRTDDTIWPIPIKFLNNRTANNVLLNERTTSLGLARRFVANADRVGFYRVRYSGLLQDEIQTMITSEKMSSIDKWAVQNDLFAFCLSGRASVSEYLELVGAYMDETEYLPLSNIGKNLEFLMNMSYGEVWCDDVVKVARPLFSGMMDRLGWKPRPQDAHTDVFLRSMGIASLSRLDDSAAKMAKNMFAKFLDGGTLHPDMRAPIMSAVARRGDAHTHDQLKSLFHSSVSIEEQTRILAGMCTFEKPDLLESTLDFSLSESVRPQNAYMPVALVASNPAGRHMWWPWVSSHWEDLVCKLGHGNPLFGRIIKAISMLADDSYADDIMLFLNDHPISGTERTQKQALELLAIYADLRRRAPSDMADMLETARA